MRTAASSLRCKDRCDEVRLILRSPVCDLVSSSNCLMITLKRFSLCLLTDCCVET